MNKYNLHIGETEYYECDGEVLGKSNKIYVNGIEIGEYIDFCDEDNPIEFINVLNSFKGDKFIIKVIPEKTGDSYEDFEYFTYFNDYKTRSNELRVHLDILEKFNINYEVHEYDVDYEEMRNGVFKLDEDVDITIYEY